MVAARIFCLRCCVEQTSRPWFGILWHSFSHVSLYNCRRRARIHSIQSVAEFTPYLSKQWRLLFRVLLAGIPVAFLASMHHQYFLYLCFPRFTGGNDRVRTAKVCFNQDAYGETKFDKTGCGLVPKIAALVIVLYELLIWITVFVDWHLDLKWRRKYCPGRCGHFVYQRNWQYGCHHVCRFRSAYNRNGIDAKLSFHLFVCLHCHGFFYCQQLSQQVVVLYTACTTLTATERSCSYYETLLKWCINIRHKIRYDSTFLLTNLESGE